MILLDTSGLLAWLDSGQRDHRAVVQSMEVVKPPFILSPFILAEADYLISTRIGSREQSLLLSEVERGALRLVSISASDIAQARKVMERYADLKIGLADASLAVLSERYQVLEILSLDERHFRVVRGFRGEPFRMLPADAA